MKIHEATEQAYKNGYKHGYEAGKPKWISVKDRLPDKNDKYFVFKKNMFGCWCDVLGFAKDGRKVDKYDFRDQWKNVWYYYDSEYGYGVSENVTHWMPLPEMPEGE